MSLISLNPKNTPDIYKHDSTLKEWRFDSDLASNGYSYKLPVDSPFGTFDDKENKFLDTLKSKRNTLKHRWKKFLTQETEKTLLHKLNEASQIIHCSNPRLTYFQIHPTDKYVWLENLKSLDFDIQSLAESFPIRSFEESTIIDELFKSKISIPIASWIIKMFYTKNNYSSSSSSSKENTSSSSSSNSKLSEDFANMLIKYVLDPLFDDHTIDTEKSQYFVHLIFYCTEEKMIEISLFENWIFKKVDILKILFIDYCKKAYNIEFSDSITLQKMILEMSQIQTLSHSQSLNQGSNQGNQFQKRSNFFNPTDFIMTQMIYSILSNNENLILPQKKILLENIILLIEKYSKNLPRFCQQLTKIPCGEISYDLIHSSSKSDILSESNIDFWHYSPSSLIKELNSLLSTGELNRVFKKLFSSEKHFIEPILLLFKWSCVDIDIEFPNNYRKIYICNSLLERLHYHLLKFKNFKNQFLSTFGEQTKKFEFPLQEYFYTVFNEFEEIMIKYKENQSKIKPILSRIFIIFSYLEERNIFSFRSYSDWLIKENKLKFGKYSNDNLQNEFHCLFLKNCSIYEQNYEENQNSKKDGIDPVISNNIRIRRTFLQRLGVNPDEDELLVKKFISHFPNAFEIQNFNGEILKQIFQSSTFCQFSFSRYIRRINLLSLSQLKNSIFQQERESYLKLIFSIIHEIGDFKSFEQLIFELSKWIIQDQRDNTPNSSILETFIMSTLMNYTHYFIYNGHFKQFIEFLKKTPVLNLQNDYIKSIFEPLSINFPYISKKEEEILKYRSQNKTINLYSVIPISREYKLNIEELFNNLYNEPLNLDYLYLIRFNLMRGSFKLQDVHNRFVKIVIAQLETSYHITQIFEPIYQYISENIITVPMFIESFLYQLQGISQNILERIDEFFSMFLNQNNYNINYNSNYPIIANQFFSYLQFSHCVLSSLPKKIENIFNLYKKFNEIDNGISLKILNKLLTSASFQSHYSLSTEKSNNFSEILEIIYDEKILKDSEKNFILKSILQNIIPSESRIHQPFIDFNFEELLEEVKRDIDVWKGWVICSILFVYSKNLINDQKSTVEDISKSLFEKSSDCKNIDLYSHLLAFLSKAYISLGNPLKKLYFKKIKEASKDLDNEAPFDLVRITLSIFEICQSDQKLAIAICRLLSHQLHIFIDPTLENGNSTSNNFVASSLKTNTSTFELSNNRSIGNLHEKMIMFLQLIGSIISHIEDENSIDQVETKKIVDNLIYLFKSRIGRIQEDDHINIIDSITQNTENKSNLKPTIRSYIFKIIETMENRPIFRPLTKSNDQQEKNSWNFIEGVSQQCKTCNTKHIFLPTNQDFLFKVSVREEPFYQRKRKRINQEMDSMNIFKDTYPPKHMQNGNGVYSLQEDNYFS